MIAIKFILWNCISSYGSDLKIEWILSSASLSLEDKNVSLRTAYWF